MLMNVLHFVISIWVPLVCALVIVAVLPLVAGYIVLMERKVMADMQARLGPDARRAARIAAADRGRAEAAHQGRHHSG